MGELIPLLLIIVLLMFLGGIVGYGVGFMQHRDAAYVMLGYDEYIDETCRDEFEAELNEWFGKNWRLNWNPFSKFFDLRNFPEVVEVEVLNEEDKIIGRVEITNNFKIEGDDLGRYIEIEPIGIKKL